MAIRRKSSGSSENKRSPSPSIFQPLLFKKLTEKVFLKRSKIRNGSRFSM
jgi:hypothetical protein